MPIYGFSHPKNEPILNPEGRRIERGNHAERSQIVVVLVLVLDLFEEEDENENES